MLTDVRSDDRSQLEAVSLEAVGRDSLIPRGLSVLYLFPEEVGLVLKPPYCYSGLATLPDERDDDSASRQVHTDPRIAAVSDSGHLGAAKLFGPTVCLKCTATHSTPAHRCCCLLGCKNRWSLPCPLPGHWACLYPGCHWPLAYDNAPFLSCGNFSSGVRQGPVIDSHLSGPCPRGPCGAGGLLDLPLVPVPVSRAACAASAGRAGGSWFFNSQPLTTIPSFSNW